MKFAGLFEWISKPKEGYVFMASVRDTKCPACGEENGPCAIENGIPKYHESRMLAANPTTYEHPDCPECVQLKDAMRHAERAFRSCRPDTGGGRPKSRWPKAWREECRRQELAANLARAKYQFHLGSVHKDEWCMSNLGENLTVILREGRLSA